VVTGKQTTIRLGPKGQALVKVLMEIGGVTQNDVVFAALERLAREREVRLATEMFADTMCDTVSHTVQKLDELRAALRMIGK